MIRAKKVAIAILCVYAAFLPIGAFLAYRYVENTSMVYDAPSGSIVEKAEKNADIYFPSQVDTNALLMLVRNQAGYNLTLSPCLLQYSQVLFGSILDGRQDHASSNSIISLSAVFTGVQGYFINNTVKQFREKMIGGSNDSLSIITLNTLSGVSTKEAVADMRTFNSEWRTSPSVSEECRADGAPQSLFEFDFTNTILIGDDLQSSILGDLAVIDSFSTPLAFIALCYCIRSVRFTLVPAITVPVGLVLAYSIMYPISRMTKVSSFAPEMAAPVIVALSVDYCLFMLSRFAEQVLLWRVERIRTDESKWKTVLKTAKLTAHNVLLSGITIAVALGGLALLPVSLIATIGIGMSIGAVSAVVVAMTLMPSLLLVFFDFFAASDDFLIIARLVAKYAPSCMRQALLDGEDKKNLLISTATTNILDDQLQKQNESFWFRVGLFAFRRPVLTVACVCSLAVPFFYFASEIRVDFSIFAVTPRNSRHAATLKTIVEEIGHGSATPFYVTFTSTRDDYGVWTDGRFFELINNVTADIVQRTQQPLDRILSPSMIPSSNGLCPDDSCYIDLFTSQLSYAISSDYRALFNQTVSSNQRAALIALFTVFDPFTSQAGAFLDSVNAVAEDFSNNDLGIEVGILGASADSWAIMRAAMKLFPYQIVITFGIIFCFIAVVFRSVFIPLRMILTVAYTVGLSYGLGVLLFQYDWSHSFWHALSNVHSYTWTVPIFSFSLLCALALDYDVFLMTRIVEMKKQGYNNEAAIAKAVWKTGRIISFAGVIMFIAFGSLMFSNTTMFNEFGAVASFAVLIDTFIIRPVFGPALMSLFGTAAWWPRKFVAPEYERDLSDMAADLPVSYRGGAGSWGFGSVSQLDDVVKVNESPD